MFELPFEVKLSIVGLILLISYCILSFLKDHYDI